MTEQLQLWPEPVAEKRVDARHPDWDDGLGVDECARCFAKEYEGCVCFCAESHAPDCGARRPIPARLHKRTGRVISPADWFITGGPESSDIPCTCGGTPCER